MPRIYRSARSLSATQQDALRHVWVGVAFEAEIAARKASEHDGILWRGTARRIAEDARNLIEAVGVRVDGRRSLPRPFRRNWPDAGRGISERQNGSGDDLRSRQDGPWQGRGTTTRGVS
jgi:hypothetical protein